MRKRLHAALKAYFRAELLKARTSLDLAQEEMAHLLDVSVRAYVALEGGKSCCGLITFLLFLHRGCPDPLSFLMGLFNMIELSEQSIA
ncbi:MAG: hypothetical protein ACOYJA_10225 [Christensenellales bacterium]